MVLASGYAIKESDFLDALVDDPTESLDETEDNPSERYLLRRVVHRRVIALDENQDPLVKKPVIKIQPYGIKHPLINTKLALKDSGAGLDEDVSLDDDVDDSQSDLGQSDLGQSDLGQSGSRVIRLPYRLLQRLLRRWGPVDATVDNELPVKRIIVRVPHRVFVRLISNEVEPEVFSSGIAPWIRNYAAAQLPRWLLNPYRRRFNRNMIFLNDEDEDTMDAKTSDQASSSAFLVWIFGSGFPFFASVLSVCIFLCKFLSITYFDTEKVTKF